MESICVRLLMKKKFIVSEEKIDRSKRQAYLNKAYLYYNYAIVYNLVTFLLAIF